MIFLLAIAFQLNSNSISLLRARDAALRSTAFRDAQRHGLPGVLRNGRRDYTSRNQMKSADSRKTDRARHFCRKSQWHSASEHARSLANTRDHATRRATNTVPRPPLEKQGRGLIRRPATVDGTFLRSRRARVKTPTFLAFFGTQVRQAHAHFD